MIQPLVGRSGEWADFGMDLAGTAIGATAGAATARIRRGRV